MFSHALEVGAGSVTSLTEIMGSNDKHLMLKALHEGTFFDARPLLSKIEAPTLVIAGGKDEAVPMHHAEQLVSGINGAKLEVVPEGRHTLIWTNPDDVVAVTERFLEA
jgi:pimeloyl-ACP methyl ester carboxylesterase